MRQVWCRNSLAVGFIALPQLAAASALGPLVEVGAIFTAGIALFFMAAVVGAIWLVVKAAAAFMSREHEGLGGFVMWLVLTVAYCIFAFVLVPQFIAPGLALGATIR